jgi:hypothetical protein
MINSLECLNIVVFLISIPTMFQLDVKEAPEVVTDHPQWEFPEGEDIQENEASDLSEFTTDEDVEDAD